MNIGLLTNLLSKVTPYKWAIIGIAFFLLLGVLGFQTMRVNSLKADVNVLNQKIVVYQDNETKYLDQIKAQGVTITSLQDKNIKDEQTWKEYVTSLQTKTVIVKEAVSVPRQQLQDKIVDNSTSATISNFYTNLFDKIEKLSQGDEK